MDIDGAGGLAAPQPIGAFDFGPGNLLAAGIGVPAPGGTFQLFYQAPLAGLVNTGGITFSPAGLNSTYEVTAVASVTMTVTSVTGPQFTFAASPVQAPNSFVEFWYDATPDANPLAGTGFNDGTRILLGVPLTAPSSGVVALTLINGAPIVGPLDQFGTDNYPGVVSFLSSGGFTNDFAVLSADPTFFLDPLFSLNLNSSNITPFEQTNPSGLFVTLPGGVPPNLVPVLGPVNLLSGPHDQFQADANAAFTVVPEPATLSMLAAGVALLAIRRRR